MHGCDARVHMAVIEMIATITAVDAPCNRSLNLNLTTTQSWQDPLAAAAALLSFRTSLYCLRAIPTALARHASPLARVHVSLLSLPSPSIAAL